MVNDWGWYIGKDEGVYTSGPETYDCAIEIARDKYEGAHIVEAYKEPAKLSKFFDAGVFIEAADELAWDEYIGEFGDCLFEVTPDQLKSLHEKVREAIDKWQDDNNLTFIPFMFTETRKHQYIPGSDDD